MHTTIIGGNYASKNFKQTHRFHKSNRLWIDMNVKLNKLLVAKSLVEMDQVWLFSCDWKKDMADTLSTLV